MNLSVVILPGVKLRKAVLIPRHMHVALLALWCSAKRIHPIVSLGFLVAHDTAFLLLGENWNMHSFELPRRRRSWFRCAMYMYIYIHHKTKQGRGVLYKYKIIL